MAANMQRKRVRIGDLLVEQKIISEAQLQAALAEQKKSGRKLGRVLIENGFVDEDKLLRLLSEQLDIPYEPRAVTYLIEKHYKGEARPFRYCQPRDLLLQVRNHCLYQAVPVELKPEYFDVAVDTYFAVM